MRQKATITVELDTETEDVNFNFDFSPEFDTKNPDGNKAAIIALRMFQLLNKEDLVSEH